MQILEVTATDQGKEKDRPWDGPGGRHVSGLWLPELSRASCILQAQRADVAHRL